MYEPFFSTNLSFQKRLCPPKKILSPIPAPVGKSGRFRFPAARRDSESARNAGLKHGVTWPSILLCRAGVSDDMVDRVGEPHRDQLSRQGGVNVGAISSGKPVV